MTTDGPALAPLVAPGAELDAARLARYARHLPLPGVGVEGQRRLGAARVLVVGAGGLGSPALQYLAAAGVGTLGVVDDDVVDVTNLQRQVVHGTADLGRPKVESARDRLADLAPDVHVVPHPVRLTPENVLDVVGGYDVVLDGADNFPTRYLVSDAAEILGVPVVWGAIHQFDGQVSVFWGAPRLADGSRERGATYRDVFPVPPPAGTVPDCATGGVLGALCGTVGSVMATEAIKLITGAGTTLLGRIAVYDALDLTWRQLTVRPDPTREPVVALLPDDAAYAAFCGLPVPSSSGLGPAAVSARDAADLLAGDPTVALVDVREEWEARLLPLAGSHLVPSGVFLGPDGADAARAELPADRPVLLVCAAGARSARVADVVRAVGIDARSVDGGAPALIAAR
ncbi:ThiF family adenylyltransferase [Isoptericola sp. NEAU-Y5]|uniref:ThiF family adenylyltransferase n=1 Tax=Isoptericola luteus TaxID=2879484 RepID=A0ABS7ZC40_9MICO|nr:ThiF family adenylyltransferase [Isoptericola sp. NEAU-Y5]MCA5892590.1 ThiF family adenylyltransferase [Isoptericola sp. NEAU-Y5]